MSEETNNEVLEQQLKDTNYILGNIRTDTSSVDRSLRNHEEALSNVNAGLVVLGVLLLCIIIAASIGTGFIIANWDRTVEIQHMQEDYYSKQLGGLEWSSELQKFIPTECPVTEPQDLRDWLESQLESLEGK